MDAFLHQVLAGLATGGIYASLALALVMIYQATHLVNFAQGEMAMFSTYIAWALINAGVPYWAAFFAHGGVRLRARRGDRARHHPAGGERAGAGGGGRVHRPAGDPQQRRRLDLQLHHQDFPQPVPDGAAVRQIHSSAARAGRDRRHAGRAGAAVRVLPLHAARPGDARRGAEPGFEPAGRHPRGLDAGARLGPGGRDRRGRRHDGRADRLSRSRT